MYINKRAMLSNVYDICTVVVHLRVSHAHEQSVRIHQIFERLGLVRGANVKGSKKERGRVLKC